MPRQHAGVGRIIARPTAILDSYRAEDEEVLYDDAPSFNAFLIDQLPGLVLVLVAAVLVVAWAANGGSTVVTGLVLITLGGFTFYLWVQRFRQLYTRYVLTSFRVLRIRGILRRENAWIPWGRVTDVRYESSLLGRMLGYATVSIDSANELSSLKELRNLRDPARFEAALVEIVKAKQGDVKISKNTGEEVVAQSARSNVDDVVAQLAELLTSGPVTITLRSSGSPDGTPVQQEIVVDDFSGSDGLDEEEALYGD
jgi:membrane protein YdbS with pleckstrin-like domain